MNVLFNYSTSSLKRKKEDVETSKMEDVEISELREEVQRLSIDKTRLLTEVESLKQDSNDGVLDLMKVDQDLDRDKLLRAESRICRLQKELVGQQSIAKEQDKTIDLLKKNVRMTLDYLNA